MNNLSNILAAAALLLSASPTASAQADAPAEYRLKAAILYNFALFTEWPSTVGNTLNLCSVGPDSLNNELEALNGKAVGTRHIEVLHNGDSQSLTDCHIVFISAAAMDKLPGMLVELRRRPALTVADTPGAARNGVAFNLAVAHNRVTFEVNPRAARAAGLTVSSRLLGLATEVHQ